MQTNLEILVDAENDVWMKIVNTNHWRCLTADIAVPRTIDEIQVIFGPVIHYGPVKP